MSTERVGRNDPCPCGSGKKFKRCCFGRPMSPVPPEPSTTEAFVLDGPAAVLVEEENSQRWRIELRYFAKVREALGADVMNAFCRCFIHADRLTSMITFAYTSEKHFGRDSIAFGRDLHTMVWFTIGTLRELAHAIKDCRAALAKRKLLDPNSAPWLKLRDLEDRWERDATFYSMRNRAAFHVEEDVVEKGLEVLAAERTHAELSRGEGPKSHSSSLTLGLEAMHNGLGMDLEAYARFLEKVSDDHAIGGAIQKAFILAAETAGVQFGD